MTALPRRRIRSLTVAPLLAVALLTAACGNDAPEAEDAGAAPTSADEGGAPTDGPDDAAPTEESTEPPAGEATEDPTDGATDQPTDGATTAPVEGDGAEPDNAIEGHGIQVNPDAPESAPLMSVYVDYQCPHCKDFDDQAGKDLKKWADDGTVRLALHPMSFIDQGDAEGPSHLMANALACASPTGKALEFHQAAMKGFDPNGSGASYTEADVKKAAEKAGIKGTQAKDFETCVKDKVFSVWVDGVDGAAQGKGVTGTPTVILDGKQLEVDGIEDLRKAVKDAE